jgi:hypothetical protein
MLILQLLLQPHLLHPEPLYLLLHLLNLVSILCCTLPFLLICEPPQVPFMLRVFLAIELVLPLDLSQLRTSILPCVFQLGYPIRDE